MEGKRTFQKNIIKNENSVIVEEKQTEMPAVSASVLAYRKPRGKRDRCTAL